MEKYAWTVTSILGEGQGHVGSRLVEELGRVAASTVRGAREAYLIVQDSDAYSGGLIDTQAGQRYVDAVVEVITDQDDIRLDPFQTYLQGMGHIQGWKVKPTVIYDARSPRAIGEASSSPAVLVFVQRLDGTSWEHFSRNWCIHAGHLDGEEAETEQSKKERLKKTKPNILAGSIAKIALSCRQRQTHG